MILIFMEPLQKGMNIKQKSYDCKSYNEKLNLKSASEKMRKKNDTMER